MRIALGIEYVGSAYCGWERQRHCEAVQAVVERSLSRVAAEPIATVCAGRTDAGVHARGQVVHFDTAAVRPDRAWVLGVNSLLPADVNVIWSRRVSPEFHARFSARSRAYRYVLVNRRSRSALNARRAAWVRRPLDEQLMQQAGRCLIGEHDFSGFRASGCQAPSPIRTVYQLAVCRQGEVVWIDVRANAFLQHMVRNIVGVLLAVGTGKEPVGWARQILDGRDRSAGGVTAPGEGLYFMSVRYPPVHGIPQPGASLSPPGPLW